MFSVKSRAWHFGLTALLLLLTYLGSLSAFISELEYNFFLYIVHLHPAHREFFSLSNISAAPAWTQWLTYTTILTIYVHKYTRTRITAMSFVGVIVLLSFLLMLEVLLAIFGQIYLPILLPGLVMLLTSVVKWCASLYQNLAKLGGSTRARVSLEEIQKCMDGGELKTALIMLKHSPYSDELLELGYQLGLRLEQSKHWASALNLYHWLSKYDPGLSDFVTRVEEIRQKRLPPSRRSIREDDTLHVIGHYELVKKIATGATAVVYQAIDMRTQNPVALKVMSSHLDANIERERIKQWLHEAEIVAQFEHQNIARIHDAAIYRNTAYIAMDYISGYSMSVRLRKRQYITVGEFIRISKSVLSALAVAHQHGVVHGDIKPANIMYDTKLDTYIVTDFGAAFTTRQGRKGENIIVGTPSYMSPEQLEGKKMDGRSDLFSLAVTLYHLLTGHQPFKGENWHLLKQSIMGDKPDLSHLNLPEGYQEILSKALEKKTYMRFADAQQMLTAVQYCETHLLEKSQRKT